MSIIERAINKFNGDEASDAGENLEGPKTTLDTETTRLEVLPKAGEQSLKAPSKAATKVSVAQTTDQASRNDEQNIENESIAVTSGVSAETVSEFANNELYIDIERLKAVGIITPDCGMTSQSEEYQQIKRRLLANAATNSGQQRANLVMVTSSVPSEGKTFTSLNLAMSIAAEIDHTVLAIDTDIAKRDLTRAFNATGKPGLFDLLANEKMELSDVMLRTNIPNLVVVPAGDEHRDSTERLASTRMLHLTEEIANRYPDRIVIFDTPPVLASSAAIALAPQIGQLLLVVEAGKTKQETVNQTLEQLQGLQITGLILNKTKQLRRNSYDYYGYYYRQAD